MNSFISCNSICINFISCLVLFHCLIALVRTPSMMLNAYGERRNSCLGLSLRATAHCFSSLSIMWAEVFSLYCFCSWNVLYQVEFWQMFFCTYKYDHMIFHFLPADVIHCISFLTNEFLNVGFILDFWLILANI